jgi:hypothetical protein
MDDFNVPQSYDELQPLFTSLENWPSTTNLKCWFCNLNFTNRRVFIPRYVEPNGNGVVMLATGNFCSFHCASAYIDGMDRDLNSKIEKKSTLCYLYSIYNDCKVPHFIDPSPNKTIMKAYGGSLSEIQYCDLVSRLRVY